MNGTMATLYVHNFGKRGDKKTAQRTGVLTLAARTEIETVDALKSSTPTVMPYANLMMKSTQALYTAQCSG